MLVPVSDEFGKVWALQMIDEHGSKSFLKGGRFKGCVWRPDDVPAHSDAVTPVGLAEGVATTTALLRLCDLYGVEMPICNAVDAVVNRGEDPDQVLLDLFMRSLKKEF